MIENIGDNCTGCMACVSKCPKNAISIIEKEDTFLYPFVNNDLCFKCGKCLTVCSAINKEKIDKNSIYAYGARVKDKGILDYSQSGGISWTLGKFIIEAGGVFYGAVIDDDFTVRHKRCETLNELKKTQGSKYVQSVIIAEVYNQIKTDLKNNKKVMFSGTPCQCAAVKKNCNNNEYLFIIDLICHGVESQKYYKNYFYGKEKKYGKILEFRFRDKRLSDWENMKTYIEFNGFNKLFSDYNKLHLFDGLLRLSCYNCIYANRKRVGDITIGDYWGVEKQEPELYDKRGVSVLLVNTEKGKYLFENIKNTLIYKKTEIDKIIAGGNDKLDHPRGINKKILQKRNKCIFIFNLFGFNGIYLNYKINFNKNYCLYICKIVIKKLISLGKK